MRAFSVAWRAVVSLYNELFLLLTINLLWWVTGGIFVGIAAFVGYQLFFLNGPFWVAPLIAIPAGPAGAGLANVARQVARDLHVDRDFYWNGFRSYWRPALAANAITMVILSLLLLNIWFYARGGTALQVFAILWLYLTFTWFGAALYQSAVIAGLKELTVVAVLRTIAILAFANPLYTFVLLVLAALLTALCVVIMILLPFCWPALMALLGEHSLMLFMERLGKGNGPEDSKGTA